MKRFDIETANEEIETVRSSKTFDYISRVFKMNSDDKINLNDLQAGESMFLKGYNIRRIR